MTEDNLEGSVRSAIGQGEKIIGQAVGDKAMAAQGAYDYAAGKAQSALGSAKDAVNEGVNAVSAIDLSDLESRIKKNPWAAVGIAALVGLLIGRMASITGR
jgi:uncharacterized protein YjbJ (UPF0337 family)